MRKVLSARSSMSAQASDQPKSCCALRVSGP